MSNTNSNRLANTKTISKKDQPKAKRSTLRPSDKRCMHSKKLAEDAFLNYYSEHSEYDRPSVMAFCRKAKISTPTFYRHFFGIADVEESCHQKMTEDLAKLIERYPEFTTNLLSLFYFAERNQKYYLLTTASSSSRPFKQIAEILAPRVKQHIIVTRHRNRAPEVDERLCHEILGEIVETMKWWITEEQFDKQTVPGHVAHINRMVKLKIEAMDEEIQIKEHEAEQARRKELAKQH